MKLNPRARSAGSPVPRQAARGLVVALLAALLGPLTFASPALADPLPPTLVQAQGLTDTTIRLLWTSVPGATGYRVYRDGSASALASPAGTGFDDVGLAPVSTHSYRVTALLGVESLPSAIATAKTQAAADTSPPTAPGAITTTSLTSSSVTLSWGASTDDVGVVGYRILRGPGGTPAAGLADIWAADGGTSYPATALLADTSYTFGVQALDVAGNASTIATATLTTKRSSDEVAPSEPTTVSSRVFSSSRIDLTWSASSATDVSGYEVLRGGVVVGRVDLPARNSFSDNGLTASTSYTYTVRTVDSAGNRSSPSKDKIVTTFASGQVMIARGPYVQWVTSSSARISWWTNLPTQSVVSCQTCPQATSVDPILTRQHVMLLGGLTGGTGYAYTVGDGTPSVAGTFVTAAPIGTTFSFAAIGDYGGGSPGETENATAIAADGTSFIQTVGDNIYPESADPDFSTTYSDYDGRFFKQFGPALAKKVFWSSNSNKEYYGQGAWFGHMSLPNNERWYSYDWGDAHVLVLDNEQPYDPGTPQYTFAQADLAAHQSALWRIVVAGRPAYSSTSANSSSVPVRTILVQLFEAQHVSVVISGNSHNFERTFPLLSNGDPNNPVVDPSGVTYIVTGNGGNGFNKFSGTAPYWSAFRQSNYYGYLQATVGPTSLVLREVSSTGTVLDTVALAPQPRPGTISGTVTDAVTSSPIAGATVSYSGGTTTTAANGTYTFSNVVPGTYAVTASAAGYSAATANGVVVTAGNTATGNVALTPLAFRPTVTITPPMSPTTVPVLSYGLAFSEPVTGLAASDFTVSGTAQGCTGGSPIGSGATYTVDVADCSMGTVILTLKSGSVFDTNGIAGPDVPVIAPPVTIDRTAPSATITPPATPTKATTLSYALAFSESVTGLAAADFTRTGTATGCVVGTPTGSAASYTVPVSSCSTGTVILALKAGSVTDAAGNAGPATSVTAGTVTIVPLASAPTPPLAVTALGGANQATVSWQPSASDGGSPITGYTATSAPGGRTCSTTGALSCIVSGLVNRTPYTITVTATNSAGTSPGSAPSAAVTPLSGATYHALTPTRLLDTRTGNGLARAFQARVARTFQVTNRGGVPANAIGVTGNLTVTGQTAGGYLYLGPVATNAPTSSTLNFPLGDTRANGVTVALGTGGTLSITYWAAVGRTAHVIFDVTGSFTP